MMQEVKMMHRRKSRRAQTGPAQLSMLRRSCNACSKVGFLAFLTCLLAHSDVDAGAERREPDQDQEDHGRDVLPRGSASIFEHFHDADHLRAQEVQRLHGQDEEEVREAPWRRSASRSSSRCRSGRSAAGGRWRRSARLSGVLWVVRMALHRTMLQKGTLTVKKT